jgi:hypothetical protein
MVKKLYGWSLNLVLSHKPLKLFNKQARRLFEGAN